MDKGFSWKALEILPFLLVLIHSATLQPFTWRFLDISLPFLENQWDFPAITKSNYVSAGQPTFFCLYSLESVTISLLLSFLLRFFRASLFHPTQKPSKNPGKVARTRPKWPTHWNLPRYPWEDHQKKTLKSFRSIHFWLFYLIVFLMRSLLFITF